MGSAAYELDDLRQAADRAVSRAISDLVATSADSPASDSEAPVAVDARGSASASVRLIVVGPGQTGEFRAAGPVSFASFGRDVEIPALAEGEQSHGNLPTPLMVARYLASRDLAEHPENAELWSSARWFTTSCADASALGERLLTDGTRVALILVADGATCHGPKAPRAQDARAQAYDDAVCSALASGRPGRLAQLDSDLGAELGATGPQVWPVLIAGSGIDGAGSAGLGGGSSWAAEVLWAGAPYGVGWTVASWRQPGNDPRATAHDPHE